MLTRFLIGCAFGAAVITAVAVYPWATSKVCPAPPPAKVITVPALAPPLPDPVVVKNQSDAPAVAVPLPTSKPAHRIQRHPKRVAPAATTGNCWFVRNSDGSCAVY